MIKRYSTTEMRNIWSEENKFQKWLEIEIQSCYAWSEIGVIPLQDVQAIEQNAKIDSNRILEIEKTTKHDVIAFTRQISESITGNEKKWIHYGLTSTDVVDTAQGAILKEANNLIQNSLANLTWTIKKMALKYKNTVMIGRTHGVHADITSFGLKCALWFDEFNRNLKRFKDARENIEIGKISGAVGTFANTPPFIQDYVCKKIGINSSNMSTQVLQRDRHAQYLSTLAILASTAEKIAVEIRHLQRTEIREVEEGFSKGQKGSSAMPHKKNPVASENISGIARVIRGYMLSSFENIALWHERDISHSSSERIILPDATSLLEYQLNRLNNILSNLVVFEDVMKENIYLTRGVIFSQRIMSKLIEKGLTRETAYDLVQSISIQSWNNQENFKDLILMNSNIRDNLTERDIDNAFDLNFHLKEVDTIYRRVGIT